MHIDHITYEHCRGGGSPVPPTSPVRKAKDYLSSRLNRHSDGQKLSTSKTTYRPVTLWPRVVQIDSSSGLPLEETNICTGDKETQKKSINGLFPIRRQHPDFTESWGRRLGFRTLSEKQGQADNREPSLRKIQTLRKGIRDGKLERVVSPIPTFPNERRSAPTPPLSSREHFQSLSPSGVSPNVKAKSSPKGAGASPRTGGGFLNESREGLSGKFQSPFEHLPQAPTCYANRNSSAPLSISEPSSGSCYSNDEDQPQGKVVQPKPGQRTSPATRMKGKSKNPWRSGPRSPCRLCKTGSAEAIRGLCNECESNFIGPVWSSSASSSFAQDDEVKPTPPLKDRKTLSMKNVRDERQSVSRIDGEPECMGCPLGNFSGLASGGRKLMTIDPILQGQAIERCQLDVEEQEISVEGPCYYDQSESEPSLEGCSAPLTRGGKNIEEMDIKRDTSFYQFWDDVLRDHEPKNCSNSGFL
jgi:hypothetical protein